MIAASATIAAPRSHQGKLVVTRITLRVAEEDERFGFSLPS